MSRLISRATGNFTDSATWEAVSGDGIVDSEAASTAVSTSELTTPSFTSAGGENITGVALKLAARASSPSGTFTVTLRDVTGASDLTSVTVNVSDLPSAGNGWIFFEFGTPQGLSPQDYAIKVVCSTTGSQVTLYRSSTSNDFSKLLTTDTQQAPGAGDQALVCGELTGAGTGNSFTVTMDETASTTYGATSYTDGVSVNNRGTLSFGTTAATNYVLKYAGRFSVYGGGTFNIGTSGTRIPSDSTAILDMASATNVDTGLIVQNGGTFNAYGQTVSNFLTYLNTDEAAGQTALGVVSTSGWAANGEIAIASTTRTASQHEKRTISTVDSATQVTVTSGLTNAHSGTSPTQAEVIYLTRNVKIRGASASLQGYVWFDDTSTVVCDAVEFYWHGSATTNKRGIDVQTTTGSCTITGCSLHEFSVASSQFVTVSGTTNGNIIVTDSVFWSGATGGNGIEWAQTTGSGNSIDGCAIIGAGSVGISMSDNAVSITDTVCASCGSSGFTFADQNNPSTATLSGLTAHSNTSSGITLNAYTWGTFSNLTIWRNNSNGLIFNSAGCWGNTLDTVTAFGNSAVNVSQANGNRNTIRNLVSSGDSTFSTSSGLSGGSLGTGSLTVENSTFGVVAGIKTAHTQDVLLNGDAKLVFRDCLFASSTEVSVTALNTDYDCGVFSEKHDNTAGLHRRWTLYGRAITETTTFNTASPSEKLTPLSASVKFRSSPMKAAFANGASGTISVYVRKDSSYNGNAPRLRQLANPAVGIDADSTLDTFTAAADTWEQLTATTATVNDDGVIEFVVDCDGTAGSIFVDDWSVS